jgi:hypothetical protein
MERRSKTHRSPEATPRVAPASSIAHSDEPTRDDVARSGGLGYLDPVRSVLTIRPRPSGPKARKEKPLAGSTARGFLRGASD